MYGHGPLTEKEMNEKYPNRPHNHSKTIPFHDLYLTLFNPLNENKKKPTGPVASRKKTGPHNQSQSPHEIRRAIIDRFISRWRKEVGNDIYPAFRLIVPEKDRDRAMYGLKEMTLAKLLIRIMKIDRNSEDGYNLLHWKLPGIRAASAMAGDFAGRCFEVISKRPMRTIPGSMTIAEVNDLLDRLSNAQKEENQRVILQDFYNNMNAEEMMWLIRMILRQMKVGATEKTIFDIWHPDAENLFNISSSLRRVCWELYDPKVRLEGDGRGISLMQCFQPQLAAFQMRSMDQMVSRMRPLDGDSVFYIEEKLDGERMQLHMTEDGSVDGGKRFGFWSRKAKDYTYLYGQGVHDDNAALTRHLEKAFHSGVRNIILDGEMITWDPVQDAIVPFGTLKTAALAEQNNPFSTGNRPLYRVFDCLYLNDIDLTHYTLRKRREALAASINNIHRRLEVHEYREATQPSEIETDLRTVIATAGEGLVIKNPRSEYRLNERNDDWIKVKPEYMAEFGEALDCIIIGGYYGSGRRGGGLSSFLCGLRVDDSQVSQGANPMKCFSFFKVGGGFAASDYAELRHRTDGKWIDWNTKSPPKEFVELGGGERQHEKPDVWIKPCDSVVVSVKAASVGSSDQFRTGFTLRFPRFKKLRLDKDWKSALSLSEFIQLKARAEEEHNEKQFRIDDEKRKRTSRKRKRDVVIQGQNETKASTKTSPVVSRIFQGLTFFVMTEALSPQKRSKSEIEQLIKINAGSVVASEKDEKTILVADRNLVKVASISKRDQRNLVRSSWLYDCVRQSQTDGARSNLLLPFEPRHLFYTMSSDIGTYASNVDKFGDSFAFDVTPERLETLCKGMKKLENHASDGSVVQRLMETPEISDMPGFMFRGVKAYLTSGLESFARIISFGRGTTANHMDADGITHFVTFQGDPKVRELRERSSNMLRIPRIVTEHWISDSWRERTLLDEERKVFLEP